jgi:NADPH:quinone reductase-like Zn-dependent oxidoreductase
MKNTRVIVNRYGGPEVLQVVEDDLPEPKNDQVRVKILAAGVSFADVLLREGIHPEARRPPFTPGWDFVGEVDKIGVGVNGLELGQRVAALPVVGSYAQYICLPPKELTPMPEGLDLVEAVSLVLNYGTAYQMLHRSASVKSGEPVLIHGAAGGVGTALLQLCGLLGLEMYGTASPEKHQLVSSLDCTPINYKQVDFVKEVRQLTGGGVAVVFDGIGGHHLWRSYKTLRPNGRVVAFGHATSLVDHTLTGGRRSRLRGLPTVAGYIVAASLIPDGKKIVLYSIQTLKRRKPDWFRQDMTTLFELLSKRQIKPVIANCMPLVEARRAHELLGTRSVSGKIVLDCRN